VRRTLVLAWGGVFVDIAVFAALRFSAVKAGDKLVTVMVDGIHDRDRGALAEGAFAVGQQLLEVGDGIKVGFLGAAVENSGQQVGKDLGPLLAGRAFAAAVKLLNPFHVFGGHGRNVNTAVKNNETIPSHEGSHRMFAVMCNREAENRFLDVAPFAVIDNISSPAGKYHLRHLNLQRNRRPLPD
jgi:hypothetical protein